MSLIDKLDEQARRNNKTIDLLEQLVRQQNSGAGQNQTVSVKLAGVGTTLGTLGVGMIFGAAIVLTGWNAYTLNRIEAVNADQDAYIQAAYQAAPTLQQEFDRIKKERDHGKADHLDPDAEASKPAEPRAEQAAAAFAE